MKPKTIWDLTFRFVGLLGILYVVNHMSFIWHKSGALFYWTKTGTRPYEHGLWQFIFECGLILIGIYMVCGSPLFMSIIFPKDKSDSTDDQFKDKEN